MDSPASPADNISASPSPSSTVSSAVDCPDASSDTLTRIKQENRVLKMELETLKLRIKSLSQENKSLRAASVSMQVQIEQEEEFISNTLLKRIQVLKKEKETLALNYEQEEECLTNDLSRQLNQLRSEKQQLEKTLEHEQEQLVSKLMRKIEKLENETQQKQNHLEQLRREKIELENTLEQEQEGLVNRLWKRMDKLESEKRLLQSKLETYSDQVMSVSPVPPSPQPMSLSTSVESDLNVMSPASTSSQPQMRHPFNLHRNSSGFASMSGVPPSSGHSSSVVSSSSAILNQRDQIADPALLSSNVTTLREEVGKLKLRLALAERDYAKKMSVFEKEEREHREQNLRLQRKLQLEMERREILCRHLSESESSLEMDEERQFNEHMLPVVGVGDSVPSPAMPSRRPRTLSSPLPPMGRPVTPVSLGLPPTQAQLTPITSNHCPTCLNILPSFTCSTPSSVAAPNALPSFSQASGTLVGDVNHQQQQNNMTH